jgi:hypothetical protein
MKTTVCSVWLIVLSAALVLGPARARADVIPIAGQSGLSGLGTFEGSVAYAVSNPNSAVLTVVLENTSPAGNGGYLTAFVFNNPQGRITGASLSGPANFSLLGGPGFDDGVNGAPFGHFDLGAGTGGRFEGGGPPSKGLGVGGVGTFTFTLSGTGLDLLGADSFLAALSAPPGAGEGLESFVVRFRGFADGGSDKVPGSPTDPNDPPVLQELVPEPGAFVLAGTALAALAGWRWRRRERPAA